MSLAAMLVLVSACASKQPDWSGMSQSEIANWQQLGFGPGSAQTLKSSGLTPDETNNWIGIGVSGVDQILQWQGLGFSSQSAADWIKSGFNANTAAQWLGKQFTAQDAKQWIDSGFDLETAIENRSKGLQPIGQ